ncbi:L,D-transpeptidase [Rhizobiaceae bacterium n13]|uniref:L,D-transpeptidase n=1 Tax=Ferirhizobium litorale TaxID=2927786 RepID=A0AAE3QHN4_9HYPH|nr:L,D-transpeptidase [Fererhizobium litorale]MDI7863750.1 L,D-transpeptidase [Fererhizobium litorale]MDI7924150.1 L,D-transpeptidase [Fererhizobium litorale]
MTPLIRTSLHLMTMVSALALCMPAATAQDQFRRPSQQTILVTPQGDILDYVPEAGEVTIRQDGRGRRVLIDHYGNVVATEMRADRYFARMQQEQQNGSYDSYGEDGGFDARDPGAVTGSVEPGAVTRQPLDDQAMPPALDENGFPAAPDGPDTLAALPAPSMHEDPITKEPVFKLNGKSKPEILALQVFLDRQGVSPGVIDGHMGSNVTKSILAYEQMTGEKLDPNDTDYILEQLRLSGGLAITHYEITPADAAGPYVAEIPDDYSQKALLPSLAYTSTAEMLAERFHMDENFLRELNPGVDFTIPGTIIKVVNPGQPKKGEVARIIADKGRKQVLAYDNGGNLVAAYPASIGSSDTPSPSGIVTVERVALNPGYTYNPKINFQQGGNDKILNIPPGPNGPVGTVWMALSKPTYGIHGTPEPSKIGRTQSHGCIRLTNWDATELAKMTKPGVTVEFMD